MATMSNTSGSELIAAARQSASQSRLVQAVGLLEQVQEGDAYLAHAMDLLAQIHWKLGNVAAARSAFERTTLAAPGCADAHFHFAKFLNTFNDVDEAMNENQTALLIQPKHAGALELHEVLRLRLRDRHCHSEESFALVGAGADPLHRTQGDFVNSRCDNCGNMNFMTARTCTRCGHFMSGEIPIHVME